MTQTQPHGWESVTDVPCPRDCGGTVRWAEAGYVPGWRTCDLCGSHWMGDPATGRLTRQPGRAKRVTRAALAARERAIEIGARSDRRASEDVYGAALSRLDAAASPWGRCLDAFSLQRALAKIEEPSPHASATSLEQARAARERYAEALALAEELDRGLREMWSRTQRHQQCPSVSCVAPRGEVMLYAPAPWTDPGWDGWVSAAAVRESIAIGREPTLLSAAERQAIGVWR